MSLAVIRNNMAMDADYFCEAMVEADVQPSKAK